MTDKAALRAEIRRVFENTGPADRKRWSEELCALIAGEERTVTARKVMAFYPLGDEPDIRPLLEGFLSAGRRVFLPETRDGDMILREYTGPGDLKKGAFGISVPCGGVFGRYGEIDLALVPGRAFSRDGRRLGRGGGYYDRFLPRLSRAWKRGVCFPFQITDVVPCGEHDIKMDHV